MTIALFLDSNFKAVFYGKIREILKLAVESSARIYRPSFRENKPKTGSINSGTGEQEIANSYRWSLNVTVNR
jgi:hypothetical protein